MELVLLLFFFDGLIQYIIGLSIQNLFCSWFISKFIINFLMFLVVYSDGELLRDLQNILTTTSLFSFVRGGGGGGLADRLHIGFKGGGEQCSKLCSQAIQPAGQEVD